MTLFEHYLEYMTQIFEGRRPAPEGIRLTETEEGPRMQQLSRQLQEMGMAAFVRACAAQDGTELPEQIYQEDGLQELSQLLQQADADAEAQPAPAEAPAEAPQPDPDAGKHAFEVFLDCIALDDGLVQYLIEVLKKRDWKEFYKLSQITTKLDLDPEEFLYWLGNKELYAPEEEQVCAAIMDGCMERLRREGQMEVLAALLSGDKATFELFRCEAPELIHLPEATFDWYARNYLDRDYPLRMILKLNGVSFPDSVK